MSQHEPPVAANRMPLPAEHAAFIAASPFVFVMSGAPHQAPDVSPRGDAPGFVRIVGGDRLHLPDRIGNNRIDTIRNVLEDPRVALVFLVPRDERALRVSGTAVIRTDPKLLEAFAHDARAPRSVMEVSVAASTLGRSSAIARSGLWAADAALGSDAIPSLGAILADQVGGMTREEAEGFVASSYRNRLY